jgi:hypothetical protein
MDGLGILLPDHGILPSKLGILGKRFIDAAGVPRI